MNDDLSKMSQENLLVLLAFDEKSCSLLSNIDIRLFGSDIYRNIASECVNYFKVWKQPVGNHLPDLLEKYLTNNEKSEIYKSVLINLNENKDKINKEYVLKSLDTFLDTQNLKLNICTAADYLQDGRIAEAKQELSKSFKSNLSVFKHGIYFKDAKSLSFLSKGEDKDSFYLGIPGLDKLGIIPARKEQFTLMALPNIGKSFFCIHAGKMAALQRKKVLHITLEMSEEKVAKRYMQSFFAISKNVESLQPHIIFKTSDEGKFMDVEEIKLEDVATFEKADIAQDIQKLIEDLKRTELLIREFPTGFLTVDMFQSYLDALETSKGFVPDLFIIDYPDLMRIDGNNLRVDTGRIFRELRGIAMDRNMASVVVTQCNRSGEDIKILTRKHLAEDYSKVMTADNLVSLNQTTEEYEKGLARLYIDKGRNERKGDLIIISQNFSIGQFCLSSAKMSRKYSSFLQTSGSSKESESIDE